MALTPSHDFYPLKRHLVCSTVSDDTSNFGMQIVKGHSYSHSKLSCFEVFKILHGYYNNIDNTSLLPHIDVATRGNKYKLYHSFVKYDL